MSSAGSVAELACSEKFHQSTPTSWASINNACPSAKQLSGAMTEINDILAVTVPFCAPGKGATLVKGGEAHAVHAQAHHLPHLQAGQARQVHHSDQGHQDPQTGQDLLPAAAHAV